MPDTVLLGDEAVALGAVHAGISASYAYPGTPSTEITEFLIPMRVTKEQEQIGLDLSQHDESIHH